MFWNEWQGLDVKMNGKELMFRDEWQGLNVWMNR